MTSHLQALKKRTLAALLGAFVSLGASYAHADVNTPNLGLTIPTLFSAGYAPKINNNFAILDASVPVVNGTNSWTGGNAFGGVSSHTGSDYYPNLGASLCFALDANHKQIVQTCGGAGGSNPAFGVAVSLVYITTPTYLINFYGGDFTASLAGNATAQIFLNSGTTDFIHNNTAFQTASLNISTGTFALLAVGTMTVSSATINNATINGPLVNVSTGLFANQLLVGTSVSNGQMFRVLDNGPGIASYEIGTSTQINWKVSNPSGNLVETVFGSAGDFYTGASTGDAILRAFNYLYLGGGGPTSSYSIRMSSGGVTNLKFADGTNMTTAFSGSNFILNSTSAVQAATVNMSSLTVRDSLTVGPFSTPPIFNMGAGNVGIILNQTQFAGLYTNNIEFAQLGSNTGTFGMQYYNSLCSDFSTICISANFFTYQNANGVFFDIDGLGRVHINAQSVNNLTLKGNAEIGSQAFTDLMKAPTNGLLIGGQTIIGSTVTAGNNSLTLTSGLGLMGTGQRYIALEPAAGLSGSTTYYFPNDGTNGQVWSTDGNGHLSWVNQTGGSGVSVYPSTATASFPFGSSFSTATFGNATNTTFGAFPYSTFSASGSAIAAQFNCNGNAGGGNSQTNGGCINMNMGTSHSDAIVTDYTNVVDPQQGIRPWHLILGPLVDDPGILIEKLNSNSSPGWQIRADDQGGFEIIGTGPGEATRALASRIGKFKMWEHSDEMNLGGRNSQNNAFVATVGFYPTASTEGYIVGGAMDLVSTSALVFESYSGNSALGLVAPPVFSGTAFWELASTPVAGGFWKDTGLTENGKHITQWTLLQAGDIPNTLTSSLTVTGLGGVTASSFTTTGPGDGMDIFTIGNSTYTAIYGTAPYTVGYVLVVVSTSGQVGQAPFPTGGGTPSGPVFSVQYNNSGSFGGSSKFQWNGTSMTIISSVSFSDNGTQNNIGGAGWVDIHLGNAVVGQSLFAVGSQNQDNQFVIRDQQAPVFGYGVLPGQLQLGFPGLQTVIGTNQSANNFIDIFNGQGVTGEMSFQTGLALTRDIVFLPETVETVRLTSSTFVVKSSATIPIMMGVSDGSNAKTGAIGEYISSSVVVGALFPSSGNYGDLASILLSSGDWDVAAVLGSQANGATVTTMSVGISSTTGNSSAGLIEGDSLINSLGPTAATDTFGAIPAVRVSLSGPKTYYLKYQSAFSIATPKAVGRLSARRVR